MFKEFTLKSGIRGFTYAETNNKFAKLMWYGIMLGCAGMTIYDVSGTIKYFMSFPTTTKVMLINNQSINLGPPTIGISYSNFFSNWNELMTNDKYNIFESVKKYYVEKVSFAAQEDLEMRSVQTATSLVAAVVSSVTRAEHYLADNSHPYDFGWGYARYETKNRTDTVHNEGSDQVEFTYNWLTENNVSIREAAVISVKLLCHFYHFSIAVSGEPEQNCEIIKPTWLGMQPVANVGFFNEMFSFQIPSEPFTFSSGFQETTIRMKRPMRYVDSINTEYVKLDFSGGPTVLYNSINVAYQAMETVGWIRATITAQYKQLNMLRSQCSSDDYFSNCQLTRRKQMIKDLCGCNPLDLNGNLQVGKQCSVGTFRSAHLYNCSRRTAEYISAKLSSNCYQKCDRPTISFIQGEYHFAQTDNETSMAVAVDTFSFPLFEEIPLLEPKQILGSLGGNLSLYLGANFMLLYYTAFYWVTAIFSKFTNRPVVDSS